MPRLLFLNETAELRILCPREKKLETALQKMYFFEIASLTRILWNVMILVEIVIAPELSILIFLSVLCEVGDDRWYVYYSWRYS